MTNPKLRGHGIGMRLLKSAVEFSQSRGYTSITLWTVAGLDAARQLYEALGFRLTTEETHERWGALVTEQRFDLMLNRQRAAPMSSR